MTGRVGPDPYLDWPLDAGDRGREVWYSLVTHQERPIAFWFRYTLLSTADGHREGRVWAGLTDREDPENGFLRTERHDLDGVDVDTPLHLDYGNAELAPTEARGRVTAEDDANAVFWKFEYEEDDETFTPLRSARLTDVAERLLGTGRHWSYNQSIALDGRLEVGPNSYDFEDAEAHQGHTVGRNVPETWSWVNCNGFEEDVVVESLEIEGTNAICLRADGETYFLNRLHHVKGPFANRSQENEPGDWSFVGKGDGVNVQVSVRVPDDDLWRHAAYLTPDDTVRYVAHCSLSEIEVTYKPDGEDPTTVEADSARAEWSATEPPVSGDYAPTEFADRGDD